MSLLASDMFLFVVPFLFVFAVVFGILSTLRRKENKQSVEFFPKNVNIIIALVFAFATIAYEPFAVFIMEILPLASIVLVVIFFFLILKKVFEGETKNTMPMIVSLGIFLILIGTIWDSITSSLSMGFVKSHDLLWILGIIVVVLMFYAAYSSGEQKDRRSFCSPLLYAA